jgi:hypothetical protein
VYIGIDGGINGPAIAMVNGDTLYLAMVSPKVKPKGKKKTEQREDYLTRRLESVVEQIRLHSNTVRCRQHDRQGRLYCAYEFPFTHNRVTRWSVSTMGVCTGAMLGAFMCGHVHTPPGWTRSMTPSRWQKIVSKEDAFEWVNTLEGEEFEMTDDMESAVGVMLACWGRQEVAAGVDKVVVLG